MSRVIHAIAHCLDCRAEWSDFGTAKQKAKDHSQAFLHTVIVEEAKAFMFKNGKSRKMK